MHLLYYVSKPHLLIPLHVDMQASAFAFAPLAIHQDGNGPVARALTTRILLRADPLPIVVDRDLRVEYINALELADQHQVASPAEMFARLERNAILQALSVDADAEISLPRSLTSAVIGSLADKFGKQRTQKLAELRQVNSVAVELRAQVRNLLEQSFAEIEPTLRDIGEPRISFNEGGPDRAGAMP